MNINSIAAQNVKEAVNLRLSEISTILLRGQTMRCYVW